MRWPGRRAAVPPEVLERTVGSGERVLASAQAADGTWLVGTRDRLYAVSADGEPTTLRWEEVQHADWDRDTETLRVERIGPGGVPVVAGSWQVTEPGALLTLVRERISASVLLQRRVDIARKRGFTVIARRPPSGQGDVTWAVEYDAGVDPGDPAVDTAVEAALRDAQESVGMA